MTQEALPPNADPPPLRRTREPVAEAASVPLGRSAMLSLERSRWFRPVALMVLALCAGFLVAPDLAQRNYPTEASQIGQPATENIKAPYDVEVVDSDSTARLQDDAVQQVRRVFDLDAGLPERIAERIAVAFSSAQNELHGHRGDGGDRRGEPLHEVSAEVAPGGAGVQSAAESERQVERRNGSVEPAAAAVPQNRKGGKRARSNVAPPPSAVLVGTLRGIFERVLGVTIPAPSFRVLVGEGLTPELERVLRALISHAHREPVIDRAADLLPDALHGITVQRVPRGDASDRIIRDVGTVADVDQVVAGLGALATKVVPSSLTAEMRAALIAVASPLVHANLTLNRAETELARAEARLAVPPVKITVKKGEMIIRDGERFTRRHLLVLGALSAQSRESSLWLVALGAACIVAMVLGIGFRFTRVRGRTLDLRPRDVLFLGALFIGALLAARLWLLVSFTLQARFSAPSQVFLFALPVAAGAMIARLVLRVEVALLFALTSSLALGLLIESDRAFTLYALAGAVLGATTLGSMSARGDVLRAGFWVGLGQAGMALGILLFDASSDWYTYALVLLVAFGSGLLSAFVSLSLTPAVEGVFNYTTDLKLLELANLNHPALKELIVQAPGSYHHSIIVGSLVEAAAEDVGANALLARVMAYYHDLGKGCNPAYFIENQRSGQNPHDKLKPSMSAMIIRRHITDGVELAKKHGLGEQIIAGIVEHHGTTLIHYFYHRAKDLVEEGGSVSESDYRYPGRKPQTREAALVMLADSLEAAARSLADPTPARLQGLVTRIINLKFGDGQLEECDLTLRDLHTIAKAFCRVLNSIYHERVEYPGLFRDLTGASQKKHNGDLDPKPAKKAETDDPPPEDDRPDNLRRLGLS